MLLDVVVGGLLATGSGLVGVMIQARLIERGELRAELRDRKARIREFRVRSLDNSYRNLIAVGEHARAVRAGEDAAQIARLRTQIESTANAGGDPTLFENPAVLAQIAAQILELTSQPAGAGMTADELSRHAEIEGRLATAYREAMERLLAQ